MNTNTRTAPAPRATKATPRTPAHRLTLDGDPGFDVETAEPVVYLDAFDGWVREVPGTLVPPAVWYRVESIATGETLR